MVIDTFEQVQYTLGTEEQLHNVHGLMEHLTYASSTRTPPVVISDSTSLGSGKLGFVVRQLDEYEVSDQDFALATQQLQTLSLVGMPMVGVKLRSKLESNVDFALRSVVFNLFQSAMNIVDFYGIAKQELGPDNIKPFATLLGIKYMMMAYTRTQVFK
jgi:hypothetical protein